MPMKARSVVPSKAGAICNLAEFKVAASPFARFGQPRCSFPLILIEQEGSFGKALKFVENLIDRRMYLWYSCSSLEK